MKERRMVKEQLKTLKKRLGWVRDESLSLHDRCEEQKEMIIKMKNTLEILSDDKQYFQQQLFKSKRIGKLLSKQLDEYSTKFPDFRADEEIFDDEQYYIL